MTRATCHPEPAAAGEGSASPALLPRLLSFAVIVLALARPAYPQKTFSTPTPLLKGATLIVGLTDEKEFAADAKLPVVQLAARLRALSLPGVYVEVAPYARHNDVFRFLLAASGRDENGRCSPGCRDVHILLYGHARGADAAIHLARDLHRLNILVALAVRVDSVATNSSTIPANVARAANLYQGNSWLRRSGTVIVAEDPQKTEILGNLCFTVEGRWVSLPQSQVPQRKPDAVAPVSDYEPVVWNRVEDFILEELRREGIAIPPPPHP